MWRYWNSEVIDFFTFHTILGYKGILYQICVTEDGTLSERAFRIHIKRLGAKFDNWWVLRINVSGDWEFSNLSPLSQKNSLVSMIMERIGIESLQSTDFYK